MKIKLHQLAVLMILFGVAWAGVMPCERIYEYASDEELKLDLLDNGRSLEGPEVSK